MTQETEAGMIDPRREPMAEGWAVELRVSRYVARDAIGGGRGPCEREYHSSHYLGSLTEAQANELYRLADAVLENASSRQRTRA